jgi:hypothetical protein
MPNRRTRCLPNLTASPSETAKPCEVPVPLVSESVWANADTAANQSTISASQTFTCHRPLRLARTPPTAVHRRLLSQRSAEVRQRPPTTRLPRRGRSKNLRYRMPGPSRARRDQRTMAASDAPRVRKPGLRLQGPRLEYCREVSWHLEIRSGAMSCKPPVRKFSGPAQRVVRAGPNHRCRIGRNSANGFPDRTGKNPQTARADIVTWPDRRV